MTCFCGVFYKTEMTESLDRYGLVSFFFLIVHLIFFRDLGNIAFHIAVNLMMGHSLT